MQLSVASADLYAAALAYATHEVVPERMIHGDPPIYSDAVLSRIHSELALATRREVAWSIGYGFVEAQSIWEHVLGASSDSDDRAALVWGGFSTFGWWGSKLLVSMAFLHEALV